MLLKEGKNGKWDFKTLYEFEIIPDLLLESLKKNFNNAMLIISKITTWENVDAMYEKAAYFSEQRKNTTIIDLNSIIAENFQRMFIMIFHLIWQKIQKVLSALERNLPGGNFLTEQFRRQGQKS